ncbi:Ppx/GppA phosphatase family protein [soil metagenome]
MVAQAVTEAAIDIGTNSTRLLVVEGESEMRETVVTGLGRGIAHSSRISSRAISETIAVLERFRQTMDRAGVGSWRAVATSATRDAANRDDFLVAAAAALRGPVDVISGREEAALSYRGATAGMVEVGGVVVIDIGGGSTEVISAEGALSVDVGSVRLTDLCLPSRPASREALDDGFSYTRRVLSPVPRLGSRGIGVAGTWTSIGGLEAGDAADVHGLTLDRATVDRWVVTLGGLTVEETRRLGGLDPDRAPVILAGAVVAAAVMDHLGLGSVVVSERDLLDGVVATLQD